jgi:hypothetical protein
MAGRNLEVSEFPAWNEAALAASLQAIFDFAQSRTRSTVDWYFSRKAWRALGAMVLRSLAILLIGLGGLVPIAHSVLVAAGPTAPAAARTRDLSEFGYVAFGFAAILFAFDHS